MTDNEIIKALECCLPQNGKRNCDDCPYAECEKGCADKMIKDSLDLINRQKAGIERLKRYDEERDIALHARLIANAKTEAIREFAEKIKVHCNEIVNQEWNKKTSPVSWSDAYEDFIDDIDKFVKEMTEGGNGYNS